ncbi:unnamed protein product [Acanthosepion pharaonis]|uniref:Uncharacterized protein n=1 Tax=Acanthosepion pharaonis TaxID=158019 RepID=A0A812DY95_ACAPH|nr:unnamed protein product [Sepia pharaonis]
MAVRGANLLAIYKEQKETKMLNRERMRERKKRKYIIFIFNFYFFHIFIYPTFFPAFLLHPLFLLNSLFFSFFLSLFSSSFSVFFLCFPLLFLYVLSLSSSSFSVFLCFSSSSFPAFFLCFPLLFLYVLSVSITPLPSLQIAPFFNISDCIFLSQHALLSFTLFFLCIFFLPYLSIFSILPHNLSKLSFTLFLPLFSLSIFLPHLSLNFFYSCSLNLSACPSLFHSLLSSLILYPLPNPTLFVTFFYPVSLLKFSSLFFFLFNSMISLFVSLFLSFSLSLSVSHIQLFIIRLLFSFFSDLIIPAFLLDYGQHAMSRLPDPSSFFILFFPLFSFSTFLQHLLLHLPLSAYSSFFHSLLSLYLSYLSLNILHTPSQSLKTLFYSLLSSS